ncbi:MAG: proton-conducting transporter membrane subunit [Pseudomonadota bacterium]
MSPFASQLAPAAYLPFVAALAYASVAIFGLTRNPSATLTVNAARLAGIIGFVAAIASLAAALMTLGTGGVTASALGYAFRLDALSGMMLGVVSFVGMVVIAFSRNYLDGDPRHAHFMARLCLTLCAVTLLVSASNLYQLVGAWIGMSLALHELLVFRKERRGAVIAARKKFVLARIGDTCLLVAAILLARAFGSTELATIFEAAKAASAAGAVPAEAMVASALIGATALLKSAQFPAHGWITEVMETPTPVSALLHAGVVNAGGFLLIRFADVFMLNAGAMHIVAFVGAATAIFGAAVMLTQSSIKVQLAYSTVAQMGFMIMQCGFGAFSAAALHIAAHSFYKAYAFLSSGDAVRNVEALKKAPKAEAKPAYVALAAAMAVTAYAVGSTLFAGLLGHNAATLTLGAIFVMGVFVFLKEGASNISLIARIAPAALAATAIYFGLQFAFAVAFAGVAPAPAEPGAVGAALMATTILAFLGLTWLQTAPENLRLKVLRAVYTPLKNGLYTNLYFDRLVGARKRVPGAQNV